MTKKDFFILIIKIFGLYSLITSVFSVLPSNIGFALSNINVYNIFWVLITLIIVVGIFVLLIFKSNSLVKLLQLDKNFETNDINFSELNKTEIIKISMIIIGGILIINNIPIFLGQMIFQFNSNVKELQINNENTNLFWFASGIKILIGFILLIYMNQIMTLLKVEKNEHSN
ncbi:MAG: hypothetical protein JST62_03165 [Bacteroidetes bacterium]|nr:hypothetical protein [Bacteroidota bacterium]